MKKTFYILILLSFLYSCKNNQKKENFAKILRSKHEQFLAQSPFQKSLQLTNKQRKEKGIAPNPYLERQWELTMNPKLGRPTPEKLYQLQIQLKKFRETHKAVPGDNGNNWVERGPDNVGGRAKAVLFDPNDASGKRVFAGSVSGGLWYNNDITNPNSPWQLTDMPGNMAVTSIDVDPNNTHIFYVGTGESYSGGAVNGNGIWKSTDGGYHWTHIFGGQNGQAQFITNANLHIQSPSGLQGDFHAVSAAFGPDLTSVSGQLVLADDGTSNPLEACNPLANAGAINGKIAVIQRGTCFFVDKVMNAQNAGAIGVLMINNVSGDPIIMGGTNSNITIPSVMISKNDGQAIIDALNNNQNIQVNITDTGSNIAIGYLVPGITHINDILTRNNNGTTEIYASAGDSYYSDASVYTVLGHGYQGLYKSVDNGNTWTQISLPDTPDDGKYIPFDLELGADNSIWLSTTNSYVYNGNYGAIFHSNDGNNFVIKYPFNGTGRIELATSKSDANKLYAIIVSTSNRKPSIFKTTDGFNNLTLVNMPNGDSTPSDDFTNGQSFYDLAIEVDPNDDETVYVGGIDWFKSTNGGNSWTQITSGYGFSGSNIHPDQHGITFNGSQNILIANDGGIAYSSNAGGSFSPRNHNFNATQFYHMAVVPTGSLNGENFLAGAQDNGTQMFRNAQSGINSSSEAQGGDGAYCFFDQDGTDKYRISNYVYNNNIQLYNYQNGSSSTVNSDFGNNGDFINQEALDSHLNILYTNYSTRSANGNTYRLRRYKNLLGNIQKTIIQDPLMNSFPTALKVSPYTNNASKLFVGLQNSKLLRVDNADTNPVFNNISSPDFIGSISDIEFGDNENKIFITFFNYGVTSIFYTEDGGTTWTAKEGNLPDIPVNCILQNPLRPEEVIIGTDLGVWRTNNFFDAQPHWQQAYNGMSSVKVTDLEMRNDYKVYASTYGRGIFSGMFTSTSDVENVDKEKPLKIYPNPVLDVLNIDLPDASLKELIIYDMKGKEIINKSQSLYKSIDVSYLKKGTYLVKIISSDGIYTDKFIKL